jgi:predicted nucleic acid-binding protein
VTPRERVVVDTNVVVSRLLLPESIAGRAVRSAADAGRLLVSEATMQELAEEVAVNGRADLMVTGDRDLLALDPFMGIAITSPAGYLAR